MRNILGSIAIALLLSLIGSKEVMAKENLVFTCSWENAPPIEIMVSPSSNTATRNDGGRDYQVVKITNFAVWLAVITDDHTGVKMQMIERSSSKDGKAGKWVDIILSINGKAYTVEGGICWEK